MIKNFKRPFYLCLLKTMVQSREGEQHQKTKSIHTGSDNGGNIRCPCRKGRQDRNTYKTKQNPEAMNHTIHNFLLQGKRGIFCF